MDLIVQPRGSVIARDGRPFAADPGAQAVSLPWPLPSTVAGALRTAIGEHLGWDWRGDGPDRARRVGVAGPLLVARRHAEVGWTVHLPAPLDALITGGDDENAPATLALLRPTPLLADAGCNLPHSGLWPLEVPEVTKREAGSAYWPLDALVAWLARPETTTAPRGLGAVPRDVQVHVSIDPQSSTARTGALFTTVGLALAEQPRPDLGEPARAMLCRVQPLPEGAVLEAMLTPLGGERRLAHLTPLPPTESPWPVCPPSLAAVVNSSARLRLILTTPAIFSAGWRPGWLNDALEGSPPGAQGLRLRLVGAAIGRRVPASGWDLQKGQPKAVRFMVPAGSVYFFEVLERRGTDIASSLWVTPLSDDAQDRTDGFGLAMPGIWQ